MQAAIQDGLYSGILGEVNVPTASSLPLYLILTSSISGTIVAAIAITVIILGICICWYVCSKHSIVISDHELHCLSLTIITSLGICIAFPRIKAQYLFLTGPRQKNG